MMFKERKKKEVSTTQISQKLDVVRCTELLLDFLSMIFGARNMHLAYVASHAPNVDYDDLLS